MLIISATFGNNQKQNKGIAHVIQNVAQRDEPNTASRDNELLCLSQNSAKHCEFEVRHYLNLNQLQKNQSFQKFA